MVDRKAEKTVVELSKTISILGARPCRAIVVLARTYSIGSSSPSSHIELLLRGARSTMCRLRRSFFDEMCVNTFIMAPRDDLIQGCPIPLQFDHGDRLEIPHCRGQRFDTEMKVQRDDESVFPRAGGVISGII